MNARKPNVMPSLGYAGEPSGPEYECWREEFCRRVMAADIEPTFNGPFHYQITPVPLPSVTLSTGAGSSVHFTTFATGGELVLLLPEKASLHMSMGNRQTDISHGQIALSDGGIPNARVTQTDEGGFRSLLFDRDRLLSVCPQAEDLVGRQLSYNLSNATLLNQYYHLITNLAPELDASGRHVAGQHLFDLAALILGGRQDFIEEAKNRGLVAARLEAMKADILTQLADPELSLSVVAERQRTSSRNVQRLFERSGTTFSDFVLEQRLLLAQRLLRNPLHAAQKISDIALTVGFQNVSYFHRAFRRRFGMTPADARASNNGNIL